MFASEVPAKSTSGSLGRTYTTPGVPLTKRNIIYFVIHVFFVWDGGQKRLDYFHKTSVL